MLVVAAQRKKTIGGDAAAAAKAKSQYKQDWAELRVCAHDMINTSEARYGVADLSGKKKN